MLLEQDRDTITAVSTAPGTGGIAVVRISGARALAVVSSIASFLPAVPESHRIYFGTLKNPTDQTPIDEVLVSYFAMGRSFTGEEVLEISCHGGNWLAHQVVERLLAAGARLAKRGEFTYRAFMNGRLDLIQAEAVLSLIESRSQPAARAALRQLKGASSKRVEEILDGVTWVAANLEANIDYAQEDIVVAQNSNLSARLNGVHQAISELLKSENQSRLLSEGFHVALLGLPNVGKSSLLNALLEEERAIVTDTPGTTRDLVEGHLQFHGVCVRLTDTAGLRVSEDQVESIGIERSRATAAEADMILFLIDGTSNELALQEMAKLDDKQRVRTILVRNKADLMTQDLQQEIHALRQAAEIGPENLSRWLADLSEDRFFAASAKNAKGLERLKQLFSQAVQVQMVEDAPMAIRARHAELLRRAQSAVMKADRLLQEDASPEFAAFELHEAVLAMHEILGRRFDDQVMDRVFSEFCLGK
ncbi:MAG: tRNA uridine-5-carboxymethylaminomethyl(34) synthesis GTPase MnmE [Bdellovibrionales bacterium]